MNLNWSAKEAQAQLGSFVQWLPYFLLIGLVIFTGWYQVRQTQARQLRQGNTPPNNQMQAITRIMPIVFGFITFGLNTATTLYFVVSNAWRIGQTHFVLNNMYDEAVAAGEIKDTKHDAGGQEPSGQETAAQGCVAAQERVEDEAGRPRRQPSERQRCEQRPVATQRAARRSESADQWTGLKSPPRRWTTPRNWRSTAWASSKTSSSSRCSTNRAPGCSGEPTPGSGRGSSRCRGRSRSTSAAGAGAASVPVAIARAAGARDRAREDRASAARRRRSPTTTRT